MEFKDPVGNFTSKDISNLQETRNSLLDTYSSTFGSSKRVDVVVLLPIEANRSYIGDNINMSIPRGRYNTPIEVMGIPEKKLITGINFKNGIIHFIKGDPSIVDSKNHDKVFRTILAHEIVHSQITPKVVVGIEPAPLLHHEIHFGGNIHYVLGFKAVSIDLVRNSTIEITKTLDEYVTQYLTMTMMNSFKEKNPVLETMKVNGLGINSEFILGAEILHNVFSKHDITPQIVESFHSKSDIRGFLAMLKKIDSKLSGIILAAGIDPDFKRSIKKLKELK